MGPPLVNASSCFALSLGSMGSSGGVEVNHSLVLNCSVQDAAVPDSDGNDQKEAAVPDFPPYIRTTATAICAVILTLGTAGNVLVPVVVCRTKDLRNSTNFFLINLSVADLLVLFVCMPPVLIELHSKPETWILGPAMCKAVPYVEMTVGHGSILTILAISFERYYAICKPFKAGYTCTKMRAIFIIFAVWVVALLVTCPVLGIVTYTYVEYLDATEVPACLILVQTLWQRVYVVGIIIFLILLPFLILLVVYCHIARHLMLDSFAVAASSSERHQVRARKQIVLMLIAVVLCFFLCLLPFRIFTLWIIFAAPEKVQGLGMEAYYSVLYFCRLLLYTNSALNPILYNAISSKFRNSFLRLLGCRSRRRLMRQVTRTMTSSSATTHTSLKASHTYNGPSRGVYKLSRTETL